MRFRIVYSRRARLIPDQGALVLGVLCCSLMALSQASGCGGRSARLDRDGSPSSTDAYARSDGSVPDAKTDGTRDSGRPGTKECVIAIRVDNCCTAAEPALASQVETDPCLVLYPPQKIPTGCLDKWPEQCAVIDCAEMPPLSRLVQLGDAGTCIWKSECQTDADCGVAVQSNRCCSCYMAYPRSMMEEDRCLHDYFVNSLPPKECTERCEGIMCEPCPPPQIPASCDGISGKPDIFTCNPFYW